MSTGILYGIDLPGLVPEIEEREAALFNGYRWNSWLRLPHDERVNGVAHLRLRHLIETHAQDAVHLRMKVRDALRNPGRDEIE